MSAIDASGITSIQSHSPKYKPSLTDLIDQDMFSLNFFFYLIHLNMIVFHGNLNYPTV